MSLCRFCKQEEDEYALDLIKYSVRHYAHPDCLLKAKGAAGFDMLQGWQIRNFPALAAHRQGLYELLVEKAKAAESTAEFRVLNP